jgi:hypothetical protein
VSLAIVELLVLGCEAELCEEVVSELVEPVVPATEPLVPNEPLVEPVALVWPL